MKTNLTGNIIGKHARIDPFVKKYYRGIHAKQGSQILWVPAGSRIRNLVLEGGASHRSGWASLRGSVLKFDPQRKNPVIIDGKGFTIPSGHTLMDHGGFLFTREKRNEGQDIPYEVIRGICREDLYLVHASYSHPDQLFLRQGAYKRTEFSPDNVAAITHLEYKHGTLFLLEVSIPVDRKPFNILEGRGIKPQTILIQLKEGGSITLQHS